jgi:putative component of membrane protein insertase Oxa1/YidC/SpoIIIJ protein YidD
MFWGRSNACLSQDLFTRSLSEVKYLILLVIHLYWRLVPPESRRQCLFAQSCSRHVFEHARSSGAIAGLTALWRRFRMCRPGYAQLDVKDADGSVLFRLADGSVVRAEKLSPTLIGGISSAHLPST